MKLTSLTTPGSALSTLTQQRPGKKASKDDDEAKADDHLIITSQQERSVREAARKWLSSMYRSDPRCQVNLFYESTTQNDYQQRRRKPNQAASSNDDDTGSLLSGISSLTQEGSLRSGISSLTQQSKTKAMNEASKMTKLFSKRKNSNKDTNSGNNDWSQLLLDPAVFTIWRPTSRDAIRLMISGQAVGKGLEIKGKSAKKGRLSGFVPFLQIYQTEHLDQIRTLPRDGRTQVFFSSAAQRAVVERHLQPFVDELKDNALGAQDVVVSQILKQHSDVTRNASLQKKLSKRMAAFQKTIIREEEGRTANTTADDDNNNNKGDGDDDKRQPRQEPLTKQLGSKKLIAAKLKRSKSLEGVALRGVNPLKDGAKSSKGSKKSANGGADLTKSDKSGSGASLKGAKSLTNTMKGKMKQHAPEMYGKMKAQTKQMKASTQQMKNKVGAAAQAAKNTVENTRDVIQQKFQERQTAFQRLLFSDMDDYSVTKIDTYAESCQKYGLELSDRLLWKALVQDRDISRPGAWETGRPSQPAFQDMNWNAIYQTRRNQTKVSNLPRRPGAYQKRHEPRVVLVQSCEEDALDPRGLIMAYEEEGRVLPVVSDFDCFTMGTRGYSYDSPLPKKQVQLVEWCLDNIRQVLELQESDGTISWTARWLDVLKQHALNGFHPEIPRYGFGDGKSYGIVSDAVASLKQTGAVRHGAESFNYYFPQDLDEEFLIVSQSCLEDKQVPWRYVNVVELQEFLLDRIEDGFTFPLNPKWILCDPNWKPLYDQLLSSRQAEVQQSMKVWFPPAVREQIESIHQQYPKGFVYEQSADSDAMIDGTAAMDLATLDLEQFMVLRRAKTKMLCVAFFYKLLLRVREKRGEEHEGDDNKSDGE